MALLARSHRLRKVHTRCRWWRSGSRRNFCDPTAAAREAMDYDAVIVGGGPAGLATAIRLKQLCQERDTDLSVCVLEKGAEVGSHILSGNVFDPIALNELIPDWKERGAPLNTPVTKDRSYFLTEKHAIPTPVPPFLNNHGNYVISLSQLTRWLGEQAEELGVEIFPGFAASEVLYSEDNKRVVGVATGDVGLDKQRKPTENYARGMELNAKQTIFAEGCRGSLTEDIIKKFDLRKDCDPQIYGLGLKEVWEVDPSKHESGLVQHTLFWPSGNDVYAGSFLYHMDPNLVLAGYVVGLDYKNPYLSPYEEFQKWKTHPHIAKTLEGGKCVSYGARCINEGGLQSIPQLSFPGGLLAGCSAGFLNVARIKGSHTAMKSGMLAGEALFDNLSKGEGASDEATSYEPSVRSSWINDELHKTRNVHGFYKYGMLPGMIMTGFDAYVSRGRLPFTLHHKTVDSEQTGKASDHTPIEYPKPDGKLTFDLLSNLQRSGTYHNDTEPAHLRIKPELDHVPQDVSYQEYAAPESRFCPAKVYEYTKDESGKPSLVINSQNCIHCKCCSIKTPHEYIKWTVPEGGGGPKYDTM